MANVDNPFGLKPIRMIGGAPYNGSVTKYKKLSTYNAAVFIGDPVTITGTADTDGIPSVQVTTVGDGNAITGVVVGFEGPPDSSDASKNYSPALTASSLLVCDDPNVIFIIQDDGAATPAVTSVGLNAVLIDTHSGDTATGISGMEIDMNSDGPDTDASNQLTILRLHQIPNNSVGINAIWEVKINNHTNGYGAVGL